jgi:hypothetical protein
VLPWRNRLARTAVNREVPGSSPGGSETFLDYEILLVCMNIQLKMFIQRLNRPTLSQILFNHHLKLSGNVHCEIYDRKHDPSNYFPMEAYFFGIIG